MTWAKLSDDFADDCWHLSDAALRLHVEGLTWSGRKLLDCRIPHDDLRRFAKRPEALQELLDTGWWSDEDGCYAIRHHATYQRSREDVLKQQAANVANGKRGGRPRRPREQVSPRPSKTESVSQSPSERDRPGQARTGQAAETDELTEQRAPAAGAWPRVAAPGSGSARRGTCVACDEPLDVVESGQTTHPSCDVRLRAVR